MSRHGIVGLPAIEKKLQHYLSAKRWRHVSGCARLAAKLAVRHGISPSQAYLAGLLHDCARELPAARLLHSLRAYHGRYAPPATKNNPKLWHNPAGVYMATTVFGIRDPKVLRAVGIHSTGITGMNTLDRIVYVADYCEAGRRHRAAARWRRLAFKNLNAAFRAVLAKKVQYLLRTGQTLHPFTADLIRNLGIKVKRRTPPSV